MRIIAIWICCCAYLNCAGWGLSLIHQLNTMGYAVALGTGFAALMIWQKKAPSPAPPKIRWRKLRRRFCKPFPAVFLLVACLIFLGGVLYAPNNYDGLTYRLPRMLNWLAAGHWFWIPTINDRMNYSTVAWEWIAMPFFAVLHSDRGLFLINATALLLMPGLLFSIFWQLGAARRVAWTWMWIFPMAYGYALQAGGIGNDLIGAVFCLAAVDFGLRARHSGKVSDVWLAGLAAALMTATKLSNLPLLLPCLVAVWPALAGLRKQWTGSIAVAAIAVLISAAPTIGLNQANTGNWTGDPKNLYQIQTKSPVAAFLGNSLLLLQQSFMPPMLPNARKVSELMDETLPASWRQILKDGFPRYGAGSLNDLAQEEAAGLGLGITLLLLVATGWASLKWRRSFSNLRISAVGLAAWISVLFFMLKMGSEADARLMLSYYPLATIPVLLLPAQDRLMRFRWWKIFVVLASLSVLPALILSPSRPLWPAVSVTGWLAQRNPDNSKAQRFATVYSVYSHRNDVLAPLREALPEDAGTIGFFAGGNDTDYSLWRPFGSRRVEYLLTGSEPPIQIPNDIEWIVVKEKILTKISNETLEEWAGRHHANVVLSIPITTLVGWGEERWFLLRIQQP
jgi:hypothetical protein